MGRVRVQVYGNGKSKSARQLAKALGVKRLKVTGTGRMSHTLPGSRFVGKNTDTIINWGMPKHILSNVRYLNPVESVSIASNKHQTFMVLETHDVCIPRYTTIKPQNGTYMARTVLNGHKLPVICGFSIVLPH